MSNKDYPAYPLVHGNTVEAIGLTKRELIAAMAMQGILSNSFVAEAMNGEGEGDQHAKDIATASILAADALLEALK